MAQRICWDKTFKWWWICADIGQVLTCLCRASALFIENVRITWIRALQWIGGCWIFCRGIPCPWLIKKSRCRDSKKGACPLIYRNGKLIFVIRVLTGVCSIVEGWRCNLVDWRKTWVTIHGWSYLWYASITQLWIWSSCKIMWQMSGVMCERCNKFANSYVLRRHRIVLSQVHWPR